MPIPVPTLDELLYKRPVPGTGFRIQDEQQYWDQGNWDEPGRYWDGELWFAVELAVPPADGQTVWAASEDDPFGDEWGADPVGDAETGVWGAPNWEDLTPWVRETVITTGRSPGASPGDGEVGTMSLTIDNNTGQFMPWSPTPFTNPVYMQAGTIARVVIYDPLSLATTEPTSRYYDSGYWRALFTGPAESWVETSQGLGADRNVTITCTDTLVYLSRLDSPGLSPPPEQDPQERINYMTTFYGSPVQTLFPQISSTGSSPAVLVTTTGEGNALQNIYAAAAQGDWLFYAEGTGRHVVRRFGDVRLDVWDARVIISDKTPGLETRSGVVYIHIPFSGDSLAIANDTDAVVNKVTLTTPGDTVYEYDSLVVDQPWSEATWSFRDSTQFTEATGSAASAWLAARLLAKGATTIRPATVTIDAAHGPEAFRYLLENEPHRLVRVEQGNVHFTGPVVSRYTHTITPLAGWSEVDRSIVWTCDIEFDISRFSTWDLIEE